MTRPPPTPPTERPWTVRRRRRGCSSCGSRPPEPALCPAGGPCRRLRSCEPGGGGRGRHVRHGHAEQDRPVDDKLHTIAGTLTDATDLTAGGPPPSAARPTR